MIDSEAVTAIYEQFSQPIYKYALRLCQDDVLARDIAADVFAKVIDQIAQGKGPRTNIRSYLYETTYHEIINSARLNNRLAPLEIVLNDPGEEMHTENHEVMQTLIPIIKGLRPDDRHVIFLRYIMGYTLAQTARILNMNENNIRVVTLRAKEKIKKLLTVERISGKVFPLQTVEKSIEKPIKKTASEFVKEAIKDIETTGISGFIERITLGNLSLNANHVIEWEGQTINITLSEFKVFRRLLIYGRANQVELYVALYDTLPHSLLSCSIVIWPIVCKLRKKIPHGLIGTAYGEQEYFVNREVVL